MVEADGEWHTTDNKFASAGWRHKHPYTPRNHNSQTSGRHSVKTEGQSKSWPNVTPLLVDSDSDDEEHFVKTALSPSAASPPDTNAPSNYSESRTAANVIDLTLDSDDEDQARPPPPSPPSAAYPKRKRSEDDGYGDGHDSRRQRTVPGAPSMSRMNGTNPSYEPHRSTSLPTHDGGVYQTFYNPSLTYLQHQQHPQPPPAPPRLQVPQRPIHMQYPGTPQDPQSAHGRPGTMSPFGFPSYASTPGRANGSGSGWGRE